MPRATTKADLIKMANEQFDKLWKFVDAMTGKEQDAFFLFRCGTLRQRGALEAG